MGEQEMSSKDKMQFTSASNSNMHTMGTVQIKLQIQGQFQDVFYVFPTLSQDIILGRPFLHKFQAKIDLQEETMTLDRSFDVCAISYHTLKPGESILIAREVRQCTLPSGLNGHIDFIQRVTGLYIHPCVVTNCDNRVPVVMSNASQREIRVSKGFKLGSYTPMQPGEDRSDITQQEINNIHMNSNQSDEDFFFFFFFFFFFLTGTMVRTKHHGKFI